MAIIFSCVSLNMYALAVCVTAVPLVCGHVSQEGVDVLVATPGRVSTLLDAEALNLEDCRAIVLDEVAFVAFAFLVHFPFASSHLPYPCE